MFGSEKYLLCSDVTLTSPGPLSLQTRISNTSIEPKQMLIHKKKIIFGHFDNNYVLQYERDYTLINSFISIYFHRYSYRNIGFNYHCLSLQECHYMCIIVMIMLQ